MTADERAKAVEHAKKDFAFVQRGLLGKPTRLHALNRIEIWALALDAQLTAVEKERDEAWWHAAHNDEKAVAAEKENQRLREQIKPDYHVVEFRENGWSLQHPIKCRADLIGCLVNRAIEEGVDETGGPLAPLGRHRVDLNDDGLLFRWIAALSQDTSC